MLSGRPAPLVRVAARTFRSRPMGTVALACAVLACAPAAPASDAKAQSRADSHGLATLPLAARQLPDFERYRGRTLAAGDSFADPVTGARTWKVTDALTPRPNDGGAHDYSSGPVQVSRAWEGDHHTILVTLTGQHWLVDLRRGVGLSNWRPAPTKNGDLSFTFAQAPATPRIAYVMQGTVLHRFNTATMRMENRPPFPMDFAAHTSSPLIWLQQSRDDQWFVMMPRDQSLVIAWNRMTGQVRARRVDGLDEPHLEKDGRYVAIITGGSPNLHVWDLQRDALVGTSRRHAVHVDGVRGYFHAVDPDVSAGPQYYHHAPTGSEAVTLTASQLSPDLQHRAAQWIQSDAELRGDPRRQWLLWSGYLDGPVKVGAWRQHAGSVFVAPVTFTYEQARAGVLSVREHAPGDSTRVVRQLTRAPRPSAMGEGSFHYDPATRSLHVRLTGGAHPAGRIDARAPGAVHDGIAFVRLDGSEVRLLAHHYSLGGQTYFSTPRATISPDGRLVLFDSNMGDVDGRGDLFAVETPAAAP